MGTEGCYVDILNPEISTIVIETSVSCNINNIEIERYDTYNLEVVNTDIIVPGDIPDINADQIIGLNDYLIEHLDIGQSGTYLKLTFVQNGISQFFGDGFDLDGYLDYYEFDGGSP
jgi:hypothetical protein